MRPLFIIFIIFHCVKTSFAQDSLTVESMQSHLYFFTIEDGNWKGQGADFLKNEMSKASITTLGEYNDSRRIAEFTKAILPILDSYDYNMLVTGMGSFSGKVINDWASESSSISQQIKIINEKYFISKNEFQYYPIPDLYPIETTDFLQEALQMKWALAGIGRESYCSYKMLADEMFANLSAAEKKIQQNIYKSAIDSLEKIYATYFPNLLPFAQAIKDSKSIQFFLKKMSQHPENQEIMDAFNFSLKICALQGKRDFYKKNKLRVAHEKQHLYEALTAYAFDFHKNKMLVKMHRESLNRGTSPDIFYEVGSTLAELAAYHGKQNLNIVFLKRYFLENEKIKDAADATSYFTKGLESLIRFGQKDRWVVLDLRPLIEGFYYYPQKYVLSSTVAEFVKKYDILIIPPLEN